MVRSCPCSRRHHLLVAVDVLYIHRSDPPFCLAVDPLLVRRSSLSHVAAVLIWVVSAADHRRWISVVLWFSTSSKICAVVAACFTAWRFGDVDLSVWWVRVVLRRSLLSAAVVVGLVW